MASVERDGHHGTNAVVLEQGGPPDLKTVLTRLERAAGEMDWVIHASNRKHGRHPGLALWKIALARYQGNCPYHGTSCSYRIVGSFKPDNKTPTFVGDVPPNLREGFRHFSANINHLAELLEEAAAITQSIGTGFEWEDPFKNVLPVFDATDAPGWLQQFRFPKLNALEAQFTAAREEIQRLQAFLPLLYGTGDELEDAVVAALRLFGMRADRTEKGSNVDVAAATSAGKRFGIEVTGIESALPKKTNKVNQLLTHLNEADEGERTVLVLNAHRKTPPNERAALPIMTEDVKRVLAPLPVLIIPTLEIYRMVEGIVEHGNDAPTLARHFADAPDGVFRFSSADSGTPPP